MKTKSLGFLLVLILLVSCSAPTTSTPGITAQPLSPATAAAETVPPLTAASESSPTTLYPTLSPENAAQVRSAGLAKVNDPIQLKWEADNTRLMVVSARILTGVDVNLLLSSPLLVLPENASILGFSASSMKAAVNLGNGSVQIYDANKEEPVQSILPAGPYNNADLSPDGRWLIVDSTESFAVDVWDLQSGNQVKTLSGFQTAAPVYSVRFSPSGKQLIWFSRGLVQIMDFETGQLGPEFGHQDSVSALDLTLDGRILATAAAGSNNAGDFVPQVYLWNTANGSLLATLPQEQPVTALAFSPDTRLLAAASGNQVVLWEPASQQALATLQGHTDYISSLSFSPDGTTLASASADGTVRIWRILEP